MYTVVSNRILQTLQLIPSRDLALKRTTDSLRGDVNVLKFWVETQMYSNFERRGKCIKTLSGERNYRQLK